MLCYIQTGFYWEYKSCLHLHVVLRCCGVRGCARFKLRREFVGCLSSLANANGEVQSEGQPMIKVRNLPGPSIVTCILQDVCVFKVL